MKSHNRSARDPQESNVHTFYQPLLKEQVNQLDGDELHHAKVLRLTTGDNILVTDGQGLLATATLSDKDFHFNIKHRTSNTKLSFSVNLFVAPTKNADRIEWLVEKATEIGVSSITMIQCHRSERSRINHDRLQKVAISAMKQSQQSWLPEIKDLTPFADIVKNKFNQNFIAFVDHANPDQLKDLASPNKSYGLLIGPEGDFTDEEVDLAIKNNWKKVSLGPTRLRTETAALVGCLTLALING
jgi:16S rRNA (uracil1498-N3)-methyltransferase